MKIRTFLVTAMIGIAGLVPLAGPAHATHNCGFEPCPHPQDVVWLLCEKSAILQKYTDLCG